MSTGARRLGEQLQEAGHEPSYKLADMPYLPGGATTGS